MLLAPMLYEDKVLGVLVLAKLGLRQFRDDDLRLLEIYASFATQAMANADATERLRHQSSSLERQLRSQRDLLQIMESILTTLDLRSILEAVADRLGDLVGWDNVAIELLEGGRGVLTPGRREGRRCRLLPAAVAPGEEGLATWVVAHNEAALVADQYDDPRVAHFDSGPIHGSLICVPLRGRERAIGVLTLERTGEGRTFTDEEFELVKLFAAQVSIALQNAQAHGALARRAETDDLTGLLNHGSYRERLAAAVEAGAPFSVLMIDLDRFKLVNDTFGHSAGNDLLKQMATAIVAASRDTDAVFRYGGDEFTVILAGTDAAHAVPVAERIRRSIADLVGPGSGPPRGRAPPRRVGRRRDLPDRRGDAGRDPPRRRPRLLRREARRWWARGDGRRGPGARRRVHAPGADPDRLLPDRGAGRAGGALRTQAAASVRARNSGRRGCVRLAAMRQPIQPPRPSAPPVAATRSPRRRSPRALPSSWSR